MESQRWLIHALNKHFEDWTTISDRTVGVPFEFVGDQPFAISELKRYVGHCRASDIIQYCLFKVDVDGKHQLFYIADVCGQSAHHSFNGT
jgi:hypothetical protein